MSSVVHIFHIWSDDPQEACWDVMNTTEHGCAPGYIIDREGVKTVVDSHVCDEPEDQYSFATINKAVADFHVFEYYKKGFELFLRKYRNRKLLTLHDWSNVRYHAEYVMNKIEQAAFDINKNTEFHGSRWDYGEWGVTNMNLEEKDNPKKQEYLVVCLAHY